jgi:hypothetical protein
VDVARIRTAVIGVLAVALTAGCAAPAPTPSASASPVPTTAVGPRLTAPAPSPSTTASPSASPAPSPARVVKVACYPETSHRTTATASGSQAPVATTLTCDAAVAAAEAAAAPPGLSFAYAEFRYGPVCRPDEKCIAALPNVGRVILYRCLSGDCRWPDLLVGVSADSSGRVTAGISMPVTAAGSAVSCAAPPAAGSPLTCDAAIAAAESLVGPDPGTTSIDFGYGRRVPCPVGVACAPVPNNVGWVVFHRAVLDPRAVIYEFGVSADATGLVEVTWVPTSRVSPGPS